MASEQQMAANRQNAARSTGPKTDVGKSKSRLNAIKHGLLSDLAFVPSLDRREDWDRFRDDLLGSLQPDGGLEWLLAERVVAAAWRLARVARYERDEIMIGIEQRKIQNDIEDAEPGTKGWRPAAAVVSEARARRLLSLPPQLPPHHTLESIARYEAQLHRQFMQSLHELQRIQARRLGMADASPPAVDVILSDDILARVPQS
jgi:hypothetical protein